MTVNPMNHLHPVPDGAGEKVIVTPTSATLIYTVSGNQLRRCREEALELGVEILDTTHKSFDDCITHLKLGLFGEHVGE